MTRRPSRLAFTLIELIVVIAIMIIVMAIGTAVAYSGAFNSQKVVNAGDRASGWLVIAKNRAMRDGLPRGVRFIRNPPNHPTAPNAITEAQYIEQPDEWAPNPDQEFNPHGPRIIHSYQFRATPAVDVKYVYYVSYDPTLPTPETHPQNVARQNDITEFLQRISVGDLLLMPEIGGPYRITGIITPTTSSPDLRLQLNDQFVPAPPGPVLVPPENCRILALATNPALGAAHSPPVDPVGPPIVTNPLGTLTTYKYAFQPKPLPLRGEPLLQLTGTTIIDFTMPLPVPPNAAPYDATNPQTTLGVTMQADAGGAYFDILFAPSGQVLNNPNGIICLWVRDPEKIAHPRMNPATGLLDDAYGINNAGEQMLVTVYTRTGFIAMHPVNAAATGDPWANAKDGANSGF